VVGHWGTAGSGSANSPSGQTPAVPPPARPHPPRPRPVYDQPPNTPMPPPVGPMHGLLFFAGHGLAPGRRGLCGFVASEFWMGPFKLQQPIPVPHGLQNWILWCVGVPLCNWLACNQLFVRWPAAGVCWCGGCGVVVPRCGARGGWGGGGGLGVGGWWRCLRSVFFQPWNYKPDADFGEVGATAFGPPAAP